MDTVLIISSWPTGLYDYVQYMQMQSICIVIAYADGKYMRMPHLCRCPAYGYVEPMLYSLFSRSDPKKAITGDLNFISTDRVLNTGIIERFCFLMLCRKPAAHAVNTDAPVRLRGFSGR
uniref:Uncharacterized protein n=1 Tax=Klebsiella aerogenes TaxID=548 RepID=A0A2R4NFW8_KLEAE|nr:Hypothetical protein [Klebsiella aerogenes]